jgi:zinc protease
LRAQRELPGLWGGRSDSGLEVRALLDGSVPMTSGLIVWRGGLLAEARRDAGATQLAASLLTRGTQTRDGDSLAAEIEGMAASIEGFCGRNSVGIQLECLAAHQSEVLRRAFDCALEPAFAEHEFEEERRVTIEELISEEDDLGTVAYRAMMRGLYGQHPYARDVRGDVESLRRMTRARVASAWRGRHTLPKALLVLVGDVDLDALVRDTDGLTAMMARATPAGARSTAAKQDADPVLGAPRWPSGEREVEVRKRKAQAHLAIGYPGVGLSDPRRPAIDVLATVLGGQSGRLFRVLREELGLVYHVSAGATSGLTAGHFKIVAACSQGNLEPTRAAIDRELRRIIEEPVPSDELERARAHLLGGFDAGLQRRSRIAAHLAFGELYGLGRLHELAFPSRLAKVTARDVAKVARELLGRERRVLGLVRA